MATPEKYEMTKKWAVIDREEMRFVGIAGDHARAIFMADIASVETHVVTFSLDRRNNFADFSILELQLLHKNTTGVPTIPSLSANFTALLIKVHECALNLPVDGRSVTELTAEIDKLPPPETPVKMPKLPPILQRMAPGQDYPATTSIVKPKESVPRIPREPGAAPSKGATGKVWTIADRVHAESGGGLITKELRAKIIAACEAEGINAGTAATQYGKWKATK